MLDRNADFFSDIGCCSFVEHEIEIEKGSVPHRKESRRMTPHKSEACRKKFDILMEVPVRLRRGRGKKEGGQYRFCCDFCYLNAVTIKGAYPIPLVDESLSKLGDEKFFTKLDLGSAFWQVPLRKQDSRANWG